jgi:hypothetical protein
MIILWQVKLAVKLASEKAASPRLPRVRPIMEAVWRNTVRALNWTATDGRDIYSSLYASWDRWNESSSLLNNVGERIRLSAPPSSSGSLHYLGDFSIRLLVPHRLDQNFSCNIANEYPLYCHICMSCAMLLSSSSLLSPGAASSSH